MGLDASASEQLVAARDKFLATPWFMPPAGGVERVFAITSHIASIPGCGIEAVRFI